MRKEPKDKSTIINIKATQLDNCWIQVDNNLVYADYVLTKNNNRDNLKTYVYWQITTLPKVSRTKPKDKQNIIPP